MSVRPMLTVAGLALGDYLLWKWSLGTNQDVLALVAGLTLPPLGAAFVWLSGLLAMRLLARQTRRAAHRAPRLVTRSGQQRGAASGVRLAAGATHVPRGDAAGRDLGERRSKSGRLAA